ncbi:MAG: O-antigen ligase family protein [bacterium]|nr:O-antigen ligase family protein [bacterium]
MTERRTLQALMTRDGFLYPVPRALSAALWCAAATGYVWLFTWSLPRQPAYMVFMIGLMALMFAGGLVRPAWALSALVLLLPGLTTVSDTIFNHLGATQSLGIYGPAALVPAGAFVLGVWARAWAQREPACHNMVRTPLLLFLFLTLVSALLSVWRYSDFWPLAQAAYSDQIVNAEGMLSADAYGKIAWTVANYCTGLLLLLAVVHTAAEARRRDGALEIGTWLLRRIVVPLCIGMAAPALVGMHQTVDVWFGANRVYVWPWMNRINATFYDPNALGSFIVIAVPWVLGGFGLLGLARRGERVIGALAVLAGISLAPELPRLWALSAGMPGWQRYAGVVLIWLAACSTLLLRRWWWACIGMLGAGLMVSIYFTLTVHSGSRTAMLGLLVACIISIFFGLAALVQRLRGRVRPRLLGYITSVLLLGYCAAGLWFFYAGAPKLRTAIMRQSTLQRLPLVKRLAQLPLGSFKDLYRQIMIDRGPYARVALYMTRDMPLTGVGLGCFTVELPNWKKESGEVIYVPDTACNYYLQIAAEQGVPALLVMLAVFWRWWRGWWLQWQDGRLRWYWSCIGAGMTGMLVMFIFGMHTLAHEVQCLFWLFAAQPLCAPAVQPPVARAPTRYVWLLIGLVCGLYVAETVTHLTLAGQRARFGWEKRAGFYALEQWNVEGQQVRIRHTRAHAEEPLTCEGLVARLQWVCLHPDVTSRPVRVTFSMGGISNTLRATTHEWQTLTMTFPATALYTRMLLEIETERTWSGAQLGVSDDRRAIGVTVGELSWQREEGMSAPEMWPQDGGPMAGAPYRWSDQHARFLLPCTQQYLRLPLIATHPDITTQPVQVAVRVNDAPYTTLTWTAPVWTSVWILRPAVPRIAAASDLVCVELDVSHTWWPVNYGIADVRNLGVAVGPETTVDKVGLYAVERWQDAFDYRWAGQSARWAQRADSNGVVRVQYLLGHPDLGRHPVRWSLRMDGAPVTSVMVTNADWQVVATAAPPGSWHDCEAGVSRTWQPRAQGGNDDRALGFAVRCDADLW